MGYRFLDQDLVDNSSSAIPSSLQGEASLINETEASSAVGGRQYVFYSPEESAEAAGQRRVLFFYANWCPTCQPADRAFRENENQIPGDVVVLRVNYNDTESDDLDKALADEYGVTYQHTYVQVDGNGEVVTQWNGGGLEELKRNIR